MQTTHKISGDSAAGYATYLTSASDRGDYYTGSDEGETGGGAALAPSRWHGSPALLAELGLSPDRTVGREDLASLMRGVSPADGRELRRAGGDGSRVAGIDMTFSAPKSVSALWAVSAPYERARIEAAHSRAVAGTIARIERDVELLRSRVSGELRWERADRLLAAEFVHTSSRLTRDQERGGVPDPQLHSHVVVLGAERMNGCFAAVDSRELFRSARGNGAWYRGELAYGLQELGLEIRGRTGKDGRYFEVAGVPEKLSERWSMRGAEIERAPRAFRTRYGRDPRAGELGSITVGTRGTKKNVASVNVDQAWRAVAEEYGLTREHAQGLYSPEREAPADRDLPRELLIDVTRAHATVSDRDVHARAYELAASHSHPREAGNVIAGLVRSGELVALTDGRSRRAWNRPPGRRRTAPGAGAWRSSPMRSSSWIAPRARATHPSAGPRRSPPLHSTTRPRALPRGWARGSCRARIVSTHDGRHVPVAARSPAVKQVRTPRPRRGTTVTSELA
jgi:conjugative relaxase-like TrwC/TraI family protein